jgi:non-heme chloroperoxidase
LVLVDVVPRFEVAGTAAIQTFMKGSPDGFASLDEAAQAIAAYLPHRPRPTSQAGLRKNLREGEDGRFRWHWDPAMMSGPGGIGAAQTRLEAAARRLKMPTLLVRGALSKVVSDEGARAFLELVPHARYANVAGADHMVAGDRNSEFLAPLLDFLQVRDEARNDYEPDRV